MNIIEITNALKTIKGRGTRREIAAALGDDTVPSNHHDYWDLEAISKARSSKERQRA